MKLGAAKHIRFFSDMHQDFYVNPKRFSPQQLWNPTPLPEDKDTLLILAGDLWHAKKPFYFSNHSWIKELASRYQYIFLVLGNHDFWGGSFPSEYDNVQRYIEQLNLTNVFLLQNNVIYVGDHKFVGATLWTDYNNYDTESVEEALAISSDLKYIRFADPRYKGTFKHSHPKHFYEAHQVSKNFIFANANKEHDGQTVWVVTHHPPSQQVVKDDEITNTVMGLVANNLDAEIQNSEIDYWIHGHNHHSGEVTIGKTKILANTVGYLSAKSDNEQFNSLFNNSLQMKL